MIFIRRCTRTFSLGLLLFCLFALFALVPGLKAAPAADGRDVFTFQDHLDHDWTNEFVRVRLTAAQAALLAKKPALLGPEGQPVAYQVAEGATGQAPVIVFLANVKAGQKSSYRFSDSAAEAAPTDLKLEEDDNVIRLTNARTGISIRKKLGEGEGPVAGIRLGSGKWVGGSRLAGKTAPTAYSAKVVNSGAVFTEVECRTEYAGGANWVLTFRLQAGEPVVVVRESMALADADAAFSLSLGENFDPDQLFYRAGVDNANVNIGKNVKAAIQPGNAFVLEPWLRWWFRPEEGPVFSVFREDGPDMLSVGAGFASLWTDPKIPAERRAPPLANLMQDDKGLHLDFVVKNGQRQWMIMTPDKDASLKVLDDPKNLYVTSVPHAYVIKHGEFPLNLVKDYVLDWPTEKEQHPHLLVTKAQAARYRAANAKTTTLTDAALNGMLAARPLSQWNMTAPLTAYYATGNPKLGKFLADESEVAMQDIVDTFLKQPTVPYGAAPHHVQNLGSAPLIADAILGSDSVSPERRKKLMAQIAFCCYAMNRSDFWSEERGYSANPNMTTSVLGYRVGLGSLIATHPQAKTWVGGALAGLKAQLYGWSDTNGGWLEAPHYAMVAYDAILGSALMAHNAGLDEMVFDPRMRKVMDWFAKWSTPKDSRLGGFRHLPPVGNTYICEPTGEFGVMASIWKEKDPRYASEMQWMYRQQKSWEFPGVGGGYPTMAGYRQILVDPSIPEKAPKYTSELFPQTGVVLRNAYPTDRETYMLLLAGSFGGWRSHWDDDSGSFTVWGKGRILADDFGYYGLAPIVDHNLPSSPDIQKSGIFNVQSFAPSSDFDYVTGSRGAWQRQVALVKNDDPLAPNFFVVADTFETAAPAAWRMWFTASQVTPGVGAATVVGKEDVDTDLFFASPQTITFKTEEKSRTAGSGVRPDGSQGATTTTQIGLLADAPTDGALTYVLYPRLKTEKRPEFTSIAGGKGVKIKTDSETDYVFLSSTPLSWKDETVSFQGKSGAVRLLAGKMVLSLGEGGTVSALGEELTATKAARKEVGL